MNSLKDTSLPQSSLRHTLFALHRTHRRAVALSAMLIVVSLVAIIWHGSSRAAERGALAELTHLLGRVAPSLRAALSLSPAAVDGTPSTRLVISTVAGGGLSSDVPAKQAPMVLPTAVARDPLGRGFYVVDEVNSTTYLRFVNTSNAAVVLAGATVQPNSINLIAGGGTQLVDGLPVRDLDLTPITGLEVDPSGLAVYLCTPVLGTVRAINVSAQNFTFRNKTVAPGTAGTIVNTGLGDYRALILKPGTQDFYLIGPGPSASTRVVYKFDANGNQTVFAGGGTPQIGNGDGGPATQAKLVTPLGTAFDSVGNLLIADGGDTRNSPGAVRKVDLGGNISSLASNLQFPTGITMGANDVAYVALGNVQQIISVSSSGSMTTVVGNGSGSACDPFSDPTCGDGGLRLSASLNLPGSTDSRSMVMFAEATGLCFPDFIFKRVRYANFTGGTITIAGTAIDGQEINSVAGNGVPVPYDSTPATAAELLAPTGILADPSGNFLVVSDTGNNRVRFVNRSTGPVTLFAGTPSEQVVQPGQIVSLNKNAGEPKIDDRVTTTIFNSPQGLTANSQGVFVVDSQSGVIYPPGSLNGKRSGLVRFINFSASNATALGVVVPPGEVKIVAGIPAGTRPADVPGSIGDGNQSTSAIIFPTDAAVDAAGNLYIADQGNNRIRKIDAATGIISSLQGSISDGPFGPLTTGGATGIAFDGAGRLHIADTKNHRVLRQDTAGGANFSVIADSSKGLNRPRDLAVDAQGSVFVTNAVTHQVIRITAPDNALGAAVVVAGQGSQGYSGDGGRAELARLNLPNPGNANNDIQVTDNIITLPDGNLLFADTNNNRIRMLTAGPNQAPALPAVSNQAVDEAATLAINFTASDPNNDTLTLSMTGNLAFGTFTDHGDGTASLQLQPGYSDAGSYNLTVTASDGELTASQSFTITVNNVNRAPTATADTINSPINTPDTSAVVHLSGSGTDPDNDTLVYKWFDGAAEIANTAVADVTLGLGTHSIFLMVTDSNNASASTSAQMVIIRQQQGPNQPPVAVANSLPAMVEATSAAGAAINLDGGGSSDPDDDALSYSWKDGAAEIATTKTASVTLAIGAHSITLTVSDGRGGASTSTAQTVEVKEAADYTIFTFAGSGNYGYGGDNGPARDANFKEITAIAVDGNGNLLIVDALNRVVRRVNPQGTIFALAGNSSNGNTGDGGPANLARFGSPAGVAADHLGNVYITDLTFNRIRKVGLDGKISHFAGDATGVAGFIGDGGPAAVAKLRRPTRLTVDAQGNVYVSDNGNQRIRKIDAVTKIITTVAGNGITGFNGDGVAATSTSLNNPMGLAVDSQGALHIADAGNHRIRKVSNGIITTVAGTGTSGYGGDEGPARQALLNNPTGVGLDSAGNLYLADQQNHRARMVEAATGKITTLTGQGVFGFGGDNGKAKLATIGSPTDLWVSATGRALQLADSGNRRVRKLDKDIVPNNSPVAIANELPATVPATGAGAMVHLDGSASSDPDNDPLSYSWTDNGVVISTSAVLDIQLLIGTHTIVLTVSDGRGGVSSTAPQVVTVTASGVSITDVYPGSGRRGDRVSITVLGNGFTSVSKVTLSGAGITELTKFVSSTKLTVTLIIASDASLAPRTLTVTNPGGVTATKPSAFIVRP